MTHSQAGCKEIFLDLFCFLPSFYGSWFQLMNLLEMNMISVLSKMIAELYLHPIWLDCVIHDSCMHCCHVNLVC